jgi:hypothetical protein
MLMSEHTVPAKRYEVKMTCAEICLPEVRSRLRLHPEGFVVAYPPRQVNNVYLDTVEIGCLSESLDGVDDRSKLRFRWYGTDDTDVRGVLELKCRSGRVGWKEYSPIPLTFDLTAMTWWTWIEQVRTHAKGNMAAELMWRDRPTLLNRYVREYYESVDGQVRVTLDREQTVYEQLTYTAPNLTLCAPTDGWIVIEVKARPDLHRRVSDALSALPLQVEKNSKYVSGILTSCCF